MSTLLDDPTTRASQASTQRLRNNQVLTTSVAHELSHQVQNVLDDLLVDRPRRNIVRRPR